MINAEFRKVERELSEEPTFEGGGFGNASSRWSSGILAPGSRLSSSARSIPEVSNRGAPKAGVSTRSDCHGNGRTGPRQRRVSYTPNQGAHADYGARQTEVVAKRIGGARLSRGEGGLYGREPHLSSRDTLSCADGRPEWSRCFTKLARHSLANFSQADS